MPHKRAKFATRVADKKAKGYNLAPSSSSSRAFDDTPRNATRAFNAITSRTAFKQSGRISSEDTGELRVKKKRKREDEGGKLGESSGTGSSSHLDTNANANGKGKGKAVEATSGPGGGGQGAKGKSSSSNSNSTQTPKINIKIKDNETLAEYNRRVEAALRPGVSQAIKSASAVKAQQERDFREAKKARKAEAAALYKAKRDGENSKKDDQADEEEEGGLFGKGGKGKGAGASQKPKSNPTGAKHDISDPAKLFADAPAPRRLNDIAQAPPVLPHLKATKKAEKKSTTGTGWTSTGRNPLSAAQQRLLEEERERVVKAYREIKAGREEKREQERAAGKMGKDA